MILPVPVHRHTPGQSNSNSNTKISALTLFEQTPTELEVDPIQSQSHSQQHTHSRNGHGRVGGHLKHHATSIKKYFPSSRERSELYRNLPHYLLLSQYQAGVMRCITRWSVYMHRKLKIKTIFHTQRIQLKSSTLYKLKRNAHLRICYQKIRNKIYTKRLFHWKIMTIKRMTYIHTMTNTFKSWRLCYLHNLALRVWIRPIIEKQQNAFTKWKSCVNEVEQIGTVCIENYRLNRIHNIFANWHKIRIAIVLYKRNYREKLLHQFRHYCYNICIPNRERILQAIFFRFSRKIKKSKCRSRNSYNILKNLLIDCDATKAPPGHWHRNMSIYNMRNVGYGNNKSICNHRKMKDLGVAITRMKQEKSCISKLKFWKGLQILLLKLQQHGDKHFQHKQCRIGLEALKYNIISMRADRLNMKKDALINIRMRTLSSLREYQLCCLSTDFYLRKYAKTCFKIWLLRTKRHLTIYRSLRTAKRYRTNRIIGGALLLLRDLITSE